MAGSPAAGGRTADAPPAHGVAFGEALRVWLRVAALSFGGPAGQIAVMHRIVVDEKRWIGEARFLHALSYCTLLPGPEAQQLAIYIGWLMHGVRGGVAAGTLFVLPGLLCIMALSYVYAGLGHVGAVAALFFGLKAAVLAVVLQAVVRVGSRALRNRAMTGIAAASFVAIFLLGVPFPLIIVAAGLLGWSGTRAGSQLFQAGGGHGRSAAGALADADSRLGAGQPAHARATVATARRAAAVWLALWLVPVLTVLLALGPDATFSRIAVFFSEMAVVTFGGAYAVLAYVAQQAVEGYHWLRPGEMLDGLGMAETTPGPLIMVTQFVGFMAAYRDPGTLPPDAGRDPGRVADHLGHVHAVLPLDFSGRPVHRGAARQQGAERGAVGDHRGGRGRDPEPGGVVRAAHLVPGGASGPGPGPQLRRAGSRKPRPLGAWTVCGGGGGDLPVQGGDDPDLAGLCRRRGGAAPCRDGVTRCPEAGARPGAPAAGCRHWP